MERKEVQPIALPGIHEKFYEFFKNATTSYSDPRILEIGAGHGAFTKRLHDQGYRIEACDLHPEKFHVDGVECKDADVQVRLPYEEGSFDIILAVEVMEHVFDHDKLFSECQRVLTDNGMLLISTPNILSLKSRFRFLFTGFFYSFKPLDLKETNDLQHISALTLDQLRYLSMKNGFDLNKFAHDKVQNSSVFLLLFWPLLWIYSKITKTDFRVHNKLALLIGRILFLKFDKRRL
jgi:SAM-dependent methyltransferase